MAWIRWVAASSSRPIARSTCAMLTWQSALRLSSASALSMSWCATSSLPIWKAIMPSRCSASALLRSTNRTSRQRRSACASSPVRKCRTAAANSEEPSRASGAEEAGPPAATPFCAAWRSLRSIGVTASGEGGRQLRSLLLEHLGGLLDARRRLEGNPFLAGDHVHMQVKHHLAAGALAELLQRDAVGAEHAHADLG